MAEGELEAVFKGLAEDAAQAGEKVAGSLAKLGEKTAENEEANLARILDAEAENVRAADAIGKEGASAGEGNPAGGRHVDAPAEGPPWPVAEGTPGSARNKSLKPPNNRHTVAGAKTGQVRPKNSVVLRGNEQAVRDDVRKIAAGEAVWNPRTNNYEINGRSYGVEPSGTVYPVSGTGIVNLDRNEYLALKEIAKADGDPSKVIAFSKAPRFINNPQAIATAKAIYDGTYTP